MKVPDTPKPVENKNFAESVVLEEVPYGEQAIEITVTYPLSELKFERLMGSESKLDQAAMVALLSALAIVFVIFSKVFDALASGQTSQVERSDCIKVLGFIIVATILHVCARCSPNKRSVLKKDIAVFFENNLPKSYRQKNERHTDKH